MNINLYTRENDWIAHAQASGVSGLNYVAVGIRSQKLLSLFSETPTSVKSLVVDVVPRNRIMWLIGISSASASARLTASFALPSTGAAETCTVI
jgi:hypothetical protein